MTYQKLEDTVSRIENVAKQPLSTLSSQLLAEHSLINPPNANRNALDTVGGSLDMNPNSLYPEFSARADRSVSGRSEALDPKPSSVENADGTRTVTVAHGDSLWKIASRELGPTASPKQIHELVGEIAKASGIKDVEHHKIKPGDTVTLPAKQADVTVTDGVHRTGIYKASDGSTVTTQDDGTVTIHQKDGSEKHIGPKPEDNYTYKKLPDGSGEVRFANGDVINSSDDGTVRRQNADGTGFVQKIDGSVHNWGPNAKDNYDATPTADGGMQKTYTDGSKATTWADGAQRTENPDGTGFARKADGSEHHWGPKSTDNYDVTADGGKQITDANGTKTTTWADGTLRVENADGTGYVESKDYQHHWGPKAADNYDMIYALNPMGTGETRSWQKVPTQEPLGTSAYEPIVIKGGNGPVRPIGDPTDPRSN